jgi:hypothetical protein
MPNSEFSEAYLKEGTLHLCGPIVATPGKPGLPPGTAVRLEVTVTQTNGYVAKVEQVVQLMDPGPDGLPGFDVVTMQTSWTALDATLPLKAAGLAVAEPKVQDPPFQWVDDLKVVQGLRASAIWDRVSPSNIPRP